MMLRCLASDAFDVMSGGEAARVDGAWRSIWGLQYYLIGRCGAGGDRSVQGPASFGGRQSLIRDTVQHGYHSKERYDRHYSE